MVPTRRNRKLGREWTRRDIGAFYFRSAGLFLFAMNDLSQLMSAIVKVRATCSELENALLD